LAQSGQSACRAAPSIETALFLVVNDLTIAAYNKRLSVVVALDISATFDTIDLYDMLCQRACMRRPWDTGLGTAVAEVLRHRSVKLRLHRQRSFSRNSILVRSTSVLGPWPNPFCHVYCSCCQDNYPSRTRIADDTQPTTALQPGHADLSSIRRCTCDTRRWNAECELLLNPTKSEVVAGGPRTHVAAASGQWSCRHRRQPNSSQ
jgi:hypothetical protein